MSCMGFTKAYILSAVMATNRGTHRGWKETLFCMILSNSWGSGLEAQVQSVLDKAICLLYRCNKWSAPSDLMILIDFAQQMWRFISLPPSLDWVNDTDIQKFARKSSLCEI